MRLILSQYKFKNCSQNVNIYNFGAKIMIYCLFHPYHSISILAFIFSAHYAVNTDINTRKTPQSSSSPPTPMPLHRQSPLCQDVRQVYRSCHKSGSRSGRTLRYGLQRFVLCVRQFRLGGAFE